jgi:hypothetical protein
VYDDGLLCQIYYYLVHYHGCKDKSSFGLCCKLSKGYYSVAEKWAYWPLLLRVVWYLRQTEVRGGASVETQELINIPSVAHCVLRAPME